MAYSKVTLNGTTLMDVTQKTVTSDAMLAGTTALKNDGTDITGSIPVNLWGNGDIEVTPDGAGLSQDGKRYDANGYSNILLENPLSAGSYTITLTTVSDETAASYDIIRWSTSQNPSNVGADTLIRDSGFGHDGKRKTVTFSLSSTVYLARFQASNSINNSSGHTATWVIISLVKNS